LDVNVGAARRKVVQVGLRLSPVTKRNNEAQCGVSCRHPHARASSVRLTRRFDLLIRDYPAG